MKRQTHLPMVALSAIAFFLAASPSFAQGAQSQQQSQQQSNPPQQTQKPSLANPQQNAAPAPPPVDAKEEAAYKSFYDMNPATPADYDAQIQAGEAFLKNFPQSHYREGVYSRLTTAYYQKRDLDKMYAAGDSALALNADDVNVLTLVGWVISRGNPSAPDFAVKLDKAEGYEKHALDVLNTLTKPAGMTDDQFTKTKNDAVAQAHSGLGLVYFRQSKFDQSSVELTKATEGISDPDPTDLFILGIDDENLQKYADSAKAFDACAQVKWSFQDRCKQGSTEAKAKASAAPAKP